MVVSFTALIGGTETILTERLGKIKLNTFQRTLTQHSLKSVREAIQIVLLTKTWTYSFLATGGELHTENLRLTTGKGFMENMKIYEQV